MSHPPGAPGYRAALDYLFARTTGQWRLGLERVQALLAELGDPQHAHPVLHVAGTNGKGSVCATLDGVLRHRGLRVARYTSPHLIDYTERFQVDGRAIAPEAVADWVDRHTPLVERLGATFFEATTAMAFDLFAREAVDVAVIEVGLGGRLDATNVVHPTVAGVTSIGIDHTEWLGPTREAIAPEKAGIYKAGRPAVVGDPDPAIRALLAAEAARHGATPVRVVADEGTLDGVQVTLEGTRWTWRPHHGSPLTLATPLIGHHQAQNTMVALTMLDAAPPPVRVPLAEAARALHRVRLPGRFHRHGAWIFDVGHNPDGVAVTVETLRAVAPARPLTAVVSVLADKDWRGILGMLAGVVDRFVLTDAPTAPASRRWDGAEALRHLRSRGWAGAYEPDFTRALGLAQGAGGTALVTGSFHTVGDALAVLQVPLTDG